MGRLSVERSDRIRLDPAQPRCSAAVGTCTVRNRCARAQAFLPQGTPIEDYTAGQPGGGTAGCVGLVLVADVHADAQKPRAVKPAVRGLS